MIRIWRRSSGSANRDARRFRAKGCALRLEALEDRTLLAAGALDPTFGSGGRVITEFIGPVESEGQAVALQPDGKVVLAGKASNRVVVARYQADGSLDPGFGEGGQVRSTFFISTGFSPAGERAGAVGLVVQGDGRIVVAAIARHSPTQQIVVSRYLANGQSDATFGTGGTQVINTADLHTLKAVEVQADARIVLAGSLTGDDPNRPTSVLLRLTAAGNPDATFGTGGKVVGFPGVPSDVALQPDGRIVVLAGQANNFIVTRFQVSGTLDASFGDGGSVTTRVGSGFATPATVIVQPDGRILTGGGVTLAEHVLNPPIHVLARYAPNGILDSGFGTGGIVRGQPFNEPVSVALALQPDGKIVARGGQRLIRFTVAGVPDASFGSQGQADPLIGGAAHASLPDGRIVIGGSSERSLAVSRLTSQGGADATFGTGGRVITPQIGQMEAIVGAVLVQPDGKVVLAGTLGGIQFGLARYNPDGSLDTSFGTGGRVTTSLGTRAVLVRETVLQPDGRIILVGTAWDDRGETPRIALVRYNPDGSLDASFGTGGTALHHFTSGEVGQPDQAALQPDGRLLVSGSSAPPGGSSPSTPRLARFNGDGSRDMTFVPEISAPPGSSGSLYIAGLIALPSGQILLSVGRSAPYLSGVLARLQTTGRLDRTFGNQGIAATSFSGRLALLPSGQIMMGSLLPNAVSSPPVQLARFNADGSPDSVFGNPSLHRAASDQYPGFSMIVSALAVQPGGRVLVVGEPSGSTAREAALARLDPNGFVDPLFGSAVGRVLLGLGGFSVHLALQPDGRIVVGGSASANGVSGFGAVRVLTDDPIANPTERFVTQLYADLLRRAPDAAGLAAFVTALDEGRLTRTQVAQIFTASAEYREIVVREQYRATFGREADPGGLTAYVSFLSAGGTVGQLKAILLGSAEYSRNLTTNESYVTALYRNVLGREPDPPGRDAFVQALNAGMSRTTAAAVMLQSTEALDGRTRGWYARFLRRAAEPAGVQAFVAALQGGVREEVAIAVLAGSEEYFGRL